MPGVLIRGGAEIEIPDRSEVRGIMRDELAGLYKARTKKRIEQMFPVPVPAATVFVGPAQSIGPDEGYIWSLKLVSVLLVSAGHLNVYKSTSTGDRRRPLGSGNATSIGGVNPVSVTWSSDQARLRHSEGLFLEAEQNISQIYLCGWEIAAELEAEVYD